jgi:spermidine/putrescine transport system ATP-binding protein
VTGLWLKGLTKTFLSDDGRLAGIRNCDLSIEQGEGFSLLGPSGCGKTTTLRLIGGFETPDSGTIIHNDMDITQIPPQKRKIRTVFQRYALFPHLDAFENIAFGLKTQRKNTTEITQKIGEMSEILDIQHLLKRKIDKLSGGEQQRIALARALVTSPDILLLDEPLSALDLKLREKMQLELLELRKQLGTTFIFVTHDQQEAMVLSDRVGVMNQGTLLQVGSPEEIYFKPKTKFIANFIGQTNFIEKDFLPSLSGKKNEILTFDYREPEWMIRPENIDLKISGSTIRDAHVGLEVTVVEHAFLGQDRLTKVITDSEKSFLIKTPSHEKVVAASGERALIEWEVEDTWCVESETSS